MIEEKVKEIIAKQFGRKIDQISIEQNIADDLKGDSIDIVEVMIRLDKEFNIKISETDYATSVFTVKNIIELVIKKLEN
jgi:acyl carrier protein